MLGRIAQSGPWFYRASAGIGPNSACVPSSCPAADRHGSQSDSSLAHAIAVELARSFPCGLCMKRAEHRLLKRHEAARHAVRRMLRRRSSGSEPAWTSGTLSVPMSTRSFCPTRRRRRCGSACSLLHFFFFFCLCSSEAGGAGRREDPRPPSFLCVESAGLGRKSDDDREAVGAPAGADDGSLCPPCARVREDVGGQGSGEHCVSDGMDAPSRRHRNVPR